MRVLFLVFCVLAGVAAGLWFGLLNTGLTNIDKANATPGSVSGSSVSGSSVTTTHNSELPQPEVTQLASGQDPLVDEQPTSYPVAPTSNTASLIEPVNTPISPISGRYSYHDGIMRVAPSVVSVYASGESEPGKNDTSQGSGVIVDADGVILTNLHLIDGFRTITVVLSDGRKFAGTLIGSDQETDLAVIRISAAGLPAMKLDEAPPLRVGDIVLAIGNPFGVGQTVTQGIVSATRRRIANGSVWQNFIQIDAAINPGNSGGALINPLGQLVGVNTAVFRGESGATGIGFSIPSDLLQQVVPQIIENGTVARGWLGIGVDDLAMFPGIRSLAPQGAVITAVQDGGPAQLAGVLPMDVVVRLGEQPVYSATQLLLAVSALPPGATVKLALLRSEDSSLVRESGAATLLTESIFKVRLGTRPNLK